jgi:hypothetical protein
MSTKHDFILFRSIFDKDLFDAISLKDVDKIEKIFREKYDYEIKEGFISDDVNTPIDIEKLHEDFEIQMDGADDFNWAL